MSREGLEFSRLAKSSNHHPAAEDIDVPALGRALWRSKGRVTALALVAGLVTFAALSMTRPLYTSEARILVQSGGSSFAPAAPLLAILAATLLAIAYVLARELIGARAGTRASFGAKPAEKAGHATLTDPAQTSPLRANDLRHYLNQRIAAAPSEGAKHSINNSAAPSQKPGQEKAQPMPTSLDAVLKHILAAPKRGAPRAVLVAGASSNVDATAEAIHIARGLAAEQDQAVLIDVTRGTSSVSGPLGLPRAPGFADLAAGRASFEGVIKLDNDTPLQVIAAGDPKTLTEGDETERFTRIFDALTQTYDCVVLHADREVVRRLNPALKFGLSVVVAVLPAGSSRKSGHEDLARFSSLGCPVVPYAQSGKDARTIYRARPFAWGKVRCREPRLGPVGSLHPANEQSRREDPQEACREEIGELKPM